MCGDSWRNKPKCHTQCGSSYKSLGRSWSQLSGDGEDLKIRYTPRSFSDCFIIPSDVQLISWVLGLTQKSIVSQLCFCDAAEMFPLTLASCCSEEKPSPKTVLALLSAHWPNFCDVLVKVMFGVMVLLMITWWDKTNYYFPRPIGDHNSKSIQMRRLLA